MYESSVKEISIIKDFIGRDLELSFTDYFVDEPKFDEKTCKLKNITYDAPLRVKTKLVNKRTGDVKEQEVYLGDLPVMTDRGTFVVNGIERVVISQLVRSAGAFFTAETVRSRRYYGAKVIPNRGAWLDKGSDERTAVGRFSINFWMLNSIELELLTCFSFEILKNLWADERRALSVSTRHDRR